MQLKLLTYQNEFNDVEVALIRNYKIVMNSKYFMLINPRKISISGLVELG